MTPSHVSVQLSLFLDEEYLHQSMKKNLKSILHATITFQMN
jgi:hypothetical protein